jgi:hypothetical protein
MSSSFRATAFVRALVARQLLFFFRRQPALGLGQILEGVPAHHLVSSGYQRVKAISDLGWQLIEDEIEKCAGV